MNKEQHKNASVFGNCNMFSIVKKYFDHKNYLVFEIF